MDSTEFTWLLPLACGFLPVLLLLLDRQNKRISQLEKQVAQLAQLQNLIPHGDAVLTPEIFNAVRSDNKLKAMRLYRELTGANQQQASDWLEALNK
ncbi:hypothetical protein ACMZOO_16210 [Catenovulum sp. SX2]|uniref:hypothetical protein n=1 Tax=Catenovulum sp. SX2 TaxID=3398614 RepID=UPI003F87D941